MSRIKQGRFLSSYLIGQRRGGDADHDRIRRALENEFERVLVRNDNVQPTHGSEH